MTKTHMGVYVIEVLPCTATNMDTPPSEYAVSVAEELGFANRVQDFDVIQFQHNSKNVPVGSGKGERLASAASERYKEFVDLNGRRVLSNMYASPVEVDGVDYPSPEHAFQAGKAIAAGNSEIAAKFEVGGEYGALEPTKAKAKGGKGNLTMSPGIKARWDHGGSKERMRKVLYARYKQDRVFRQVLRATGDAILVHQIRGNPVEAKRLSVILHELRDMDAYAQSLPGARFTVATDSKPTTVLDEPFQPSCDCEVDEFCGTCVPEDPAGENPEHLAQRATVADEYGELPKGSVEVMRTYTWFEGDAFRASLRRPGFSQFGVCTCVFESDGSVSVSYEGIMIARFLGEDVVVHAAAAEDWTDRIVDRLRNMHRGSVRIAAASLPVVLTLVYFTVCYAVETGDIGGMAFHTSARNTTLTLIGFFSPMYNMLTSREVRDHLELIRNPPGELSQFNDLKADLEHVKGGFQQVFTHPSYYTRTQLTRLFVKLLYSRTFVFASGVSHVLEFSTKKKKSRFLSFISSMNDLLTLMFHMLHALALFASATEGVNSQIMALFMLVVHLRQRNISAEDIGNVALQVPKGARWVAVEGVDAAVRVADSLLDAHAFVQSRVRLVERERDALVSDGEKTFLQVAKLTIKRVIWNAFAKLIEVDEMTPHARKTLRTLSSTAPSGVTLGANSTRASFLNDSPARRALPDEDADSFFRASSTASSFGINSSQATTANYSRSSRSTGSTEKTNELKAMFHAAPRSAPGEWDILRNVDPEPGEAHESETLRSFVSSMTGCRNTKHIGAFMKHGTWRSMLPLSWRGARPKSCHYNAYAFAKEQLKRGNEDWRLFVGFSEITDGFFTAHTGLFHPRENRVYDVSTGDDDSEQRWMFGTAVSLEDADRVLAKTKKLHSGYDVLAGLGVVLCSL